LASGCPARYCCAAPVAEETVALTPSGLQSGVADADGPVTMPMVTPPSKQPVLMPATRPRATILLIFMIGVSFEIDRN
jgi:hypothetical protein